MTTEELTNEYSKNKYYKDVVICPKYSNSVHVFQPKDHSEFVPIGHCLISHILGRYDL